LHYYFSKLKDTQVVIIAGNHDYVGVRSNYSGFEWNSHVHMLRAGYMDVIYLDELNTFIYGMSYSKRDITEAIYDQVRPSDDEGIHILLLYLLWAAMAEQQHRDREKFLNTMVSPRKPWVFQ